MTVRVATIVLLGGVAAAVDMSLTMDSSLELSHALLNHFPTAFLRENLNSSWDTTSLQRLSCNLPQDLKLTSSKAVGPSEFELEFSDGARGLFVMPQPADASLDTKPKTLWPDSKQAETALAADWQDGGLSFDWHDLGVDESSEGGRTPEQLNQGRALLPGQVAAARSALLERIHEWGMAVVKNAPAKPDQAVHLVDSIIGAVETTNFGYAFTIKSVQDPHNLAFARLHLQHHNDFTYCDKVPDVAVFHCIQPADTGGNSLWLDGFALAEDFRKQYPDAFQVLATTQILHMDITDKWVLEAKHPTVQLDPEGRIERIFFNERTRDSWRQWARGDVLSPQFYAALRVFEAFVEEKSRHLDTPLNAGDIVLFDNARVMHSRTAFIGERWMEGTYFDWSAAMATWRSLQYRISGKPFTYCGLKVGATI